MDIKKALKIVKSHFGREGFAARLEVTTRCIDYWMDGKSTPKFATKHYILNLAKQIKRKKVQK